MRKIFYLCLATLLVCGGVFVVTNSALAQEDPTPTPVPSAPVITILGQADMTVDKGSTYVDAGATAYDDVDGDLTSQIDTNNLVDTSAIGDYSVIYRVKNSANKWALKERKVHVVNPAAPVISISSYPTGPVNTDITVTATVNKGALNFTEHTFTENGSFSFTATDNGQTSSQLVTINNIDKTAPTVSIVSPADGSFAPVTTALTASANDSGTAGLDRVEFYDSGSNSLIGTAHLTTPNTYEFDWNTLNLPAGSQKTVYAKAYDRAGNTAVSSNITLNVDSIIPTTKLNYSILVSQPGEEIAFDPAGTADGESGLNSLVWDFGDGSSPISSPDATIVNHTYTNTGVYDISLTATDKAGNTSQSTAKAIIGEGTVFPYDNNLKIVFNQLPNGAHNMQIDKPSTPNGSLNNFLSSGLYYEITSSFLKDPFSADLTFTYPDGNSDGVVDGTNINASDLQIYYWDGSIWQSIADPKLDPTNHTITVTVNNLPQTKPSQFAPLAVKPIQATPTPTVPGGGNAGGGGGGGGGGGAGGNTVVIPQGLGEATTTSNPFQGLVLGVSTFQFTNQLEPGMKGNDVGELQKRLKAEGFYKGAINNYYNAATEQAVRSYQAKNKIRQTGIVGPATRAALNKNSVSQVIGGTSTTTPPNKAEMIKNIQSMLERLTKLLAQALASSTSGSH